MEETPVEHAGGCGVPPTRPRLLINPSKGRSMAKLSNSDWGKIHAKAWRDPKFRKLLETDPTKAIKAYGKEVGKTFKKIVTLRAKPAGIPDEHFHHVNPYPPSCC